MIADSFSIIKGSHSIKTGTEFQYLRTDRRTAAPVNGAFFFDGAHAAPGLRWPGFLLDQPRLIQLGFVPGRGDGGSATFPALRYWRSHSYINDDIKLTPKLTMNIGLRYEYNSVGWSDEPPEKPRAKQGRLRNRNPVGDLGKAERCGARTRSGTPCKGPAMANGRCRMHGGTSTGPRSPEGLANSRRARWKHGLYSAERKLCLPEIPSALKRLRLPCPS